MSGVPDSHASTPAEIPPPVSDYQVTSTPEGPASGWTSPVIATPDPGPGAEMLNSMPKMTSSARPPSGKSLSVAGLFAGIGGIELGLHRAGLFEVDGRR
jgi:hypothetical protein